MYGFAVVLCVSALQKKRMNGWVFESLNRECFLAELWAISSNQHGLQPLFIPELKSSFFTLNRSVIWLDQAKRLSKKLRFLPPASSS